MNRAVNDAVLILAVQLQLKQCSTTYTATFEYDIKSTVSKLH